MELLLRSTIAIALTLDDDDEVEETLYFQPSQQLLQ